jgi:hypothetical protein
VLPDASGGERAQGNQPEMPRQQGKPGDMPSGKQDAQRKQEEAPNRDAQRKQEETSPNRDAQRKQEETSPTRDAQRPSTDSTQDAQRKEGGTSTEQRTGGKESTDVETTGSVDISAEKRTTIRETITRERVAPIRDVNFSVSVGIEVPRTIELRPLPARVVEIVPQYRRYRYFVLADGRIVIVEPSSYKIVYIITA